MNMWESDTDIRMFTALHSLLSVLLSGMEHVGDCFNTYSPVSQGIGAVVSLRLTTA